MLFVAWAGTTATAILGAIALRVQGIAFSMVTLAFAQVGAILMAPDPGGGTGGEEGLAVDGARLPEMFVGVLNTVNLHWPALAYLTIVVLVLHRMAQAPTGRVFAGLRDDERRIRVLGLNPYRFKLTSFMLAVYVFPGGLAGLGTASPRCGQQPDAAQEGGGLRSLGGAAVAVDGHAVDRVDADLLAPGDVAGGLAIGKAIGKTKNSCPRPGTFGG